MNTDRNNYKILGYGINILRWTSDYLWERLISYDNLEEAQSTYEWLFSILNDPKQELFVAIELIKILQDKTTEDYEYESLKEAYHDTAMMMSKSYWDQQRVYAGGIVDNFTINDDQNSDGSPINICWLTLGWVSPASNAGYFHFSSKKEFDEELDKVMALSQCDKKATADYLEWVLVDNPHLLNGYREPNSMLIALLRRGDVEAVKIDYRAKKGK